eukprot:14214666-Alexandrium_andersonii.AAC.1
MQEAPNTAFGAGVFTVSFDSRALTISIEAEPQSEIKVFTGEELKGVNDWSGATYNSSDLMSANKLLGNVTTTTDQANF